MNHRFKSAVQGISRTRNGGLGTAFQIIARYPDMIVVPWLLDASGLGVYLLARCMSLWLPVALTLLGWKVTPHLILLAKASEQTQFKAAAARINLGYLMVCGALALLIMSTARFILSATEVIDPIFGEVLMWLTIGQSTPVLFGATGLLMRVVDRGAFYDLLMGLTAIMFLLGIHLLDASDSVLIAQTLVAAQLTLAALSALLLTQCGVWPGLTALFHKELRVRMY